MNETKYKNIWVFVGIISVVAFVGILLLLINIIIPEAIAGNFLIVFFLFWLLMIIFLNFISFLLYKVIKVPVEFPFDLLISDEKILSKSELREMITSRLGVKTGISRLYITITNKRLILAANNFGFWSYRFLSKSIWFRNEDVGKKLYAEKVELNDDKDGLKIFMEGRSLELFIDESQDVLQNILRE
jgi:hypothetical protein